MVAGMTTALTAEGSCGDLALGLAFPMSMFADRSDELCGHLRGGGTIENDARIRIQRRSLSLGFHHLIRSEQGSGHQCRGFACGGNCLAVFVSLMNKVESFRLSPERLNAPRASRNIDRIEQDRASGEQAEINVDVGSVSAL